MVVIVHIQYFLKKTLGKGIGQLTFEGILLQLSESKCKEVNLSNSEQVLEQDFSCYQFDSCVLELENCCFWEQSGSRDLTGSATLSCMILCKSLYLEFSFVIFRSEKKSLFFLNLQDFIFMNSFKYDLLGVGYNYQKEKFSSFSLYKMTILIHNKHM